VAAQRLLDLLGEDLRSLTSGNSRAKRSLLRWLSGAPPVTIARRLAGREACVTPGAQHRGGASHPHNAKRGTYVTDAAGRLHPAPAPRFHAAPAADPIPAVAVGAHTREVLTGLGLSGSELDDLRDRGVTGSGDAA
jgi:crotonobetainyl-CoA:carnitine CoA-transferase CaiB-like acyl-CoA transferase